LFTISFQGKILVKNRIKIQTCKIRSIRESVDSLTEDVITHLNKINRILTEIEQDLFEQPFQLKKARTKRNNHIMKLITDC